MNYNKNRHYFMNAAEVLDTVIDIFKKSVFVQVGYNIISSIFSIVFFLIVLTTIFVGIFTLFSVTAVNPIGSVNDTGGITLLIIIFVLAILVIAIISALAVPFRLSGNIIISMNTFKGQKSSLDKILIYAIKKIPSVATVIFAQIILVIPFILIIGAALFFYVFLISLLDTVLDFNAFIGIAAISGLVIFIAFTLFILAIFYTITALSIPVSIFEGKYFFSAIKKGFLLVKKDFFRIMGLILIWQLSIYAISFGIYGFTVIARTIATLLLSSNYAYAIEMTALLSNYIISAVTSVIIAPLSSIFSTVVYINRKIKCEGYDITLYLENNLQDNTARSI